MKLITKSSLTFISATVIFFLIGSVIMYFSVRNIFSSNLNDILLERKIVLEKQIEPDNVERFYAKEVFVAKLESECVLAFSDTVLIEQEKYVLYRKLDFPYKSSNLENRSFEKNPNKDRITTKNATRISRILKNICGIRIAEYI